MIKMKMVKKILGISLFFSILLTGCTLPQLSEIDADTYEEKLYANSEYWGLGKNIEKYVSNNRDYEWYVDQYHTGEHWDVNCGPTSVEMAGRYYNPDFSHTASEARSLYLSSGGWWYDAQIRASLTRFNIEYLTVRIRNSNTMKSSLDEGNVLLVNPTMELVTMAKKDYHRVGLYVPPGTGHYLIVKGYIVVDGNTFFEVYDPWSIDLTYSDGQLKGKDRYYDETSFVNAIKSWFSTAYAINKLQ